MKSFNENTGAIYADYFIKYGEQQAYNFIFSTKMPLSVLNSIYITFMKEGIDAIEKIPQAKKEKYWDIACTHYKEMPDRLKAVKAIYVLELITSTF